MTRKDYDVEAVMYLFLNKGLGMSTGKAAAQAAHAAVEAYSASDSRLIRQWRLGGHYTKIVLEGRDTEHMLVILEYLRERAVAPIPIIDEGMTEVDAHSMTAIGVPLVNRLDSHITATFSSFGLYHDKPQKQRWWSNHNAQ